MIRLKITPRFTEDGVQLALEWVEIVNESIFRTVAVEEFAIAARREGCAYVTRGSFDVGQMMPGTFWIDEAGRRHFVIEAEAGLVGLTGSQAISEVSGQ
jgi:hypothetical protein